jgi:hypothetical protein
MSAGESAAVRLCGMRNTSLHRCLNQEEFFFRHVQEDGSCTAMTRSALSQSEINARKYHGLRESEAHKRIKSLVERSLMVDGNFHNIEQEKIWRAARDFRSFRRPDVQASTAVGKFAFEAQLSTTFLNVVVDRRAFYKCDGALLIWVLGSFEDSYRRMTTDDLLFSNYSNIFVVDEETVRLSEAKRCFLLRCHFRKPERDGNRLIASWSQQIVAFHELTLDFENQRAFYFDYAGEEAGLKAAIAGEAMEAHRLLRNRFFDLWNMREQPNYQEGSYRQKWDRLRDELKNIGINIPLDPRADSGFTALMNAMQSMEAGQPEGWRFNKLVEVAHKIADQYPQHLFALGCAIRHFSRASALALQDTTGKWRVRRTEIRKGMKSNDPKYKPDEFWLPALGLLFPEISKPIQARMNQMTTELLAEF